MSIRTIVLTALLSIGLVVSGLAGPASPASAATSLEKRMISKINQARARHGVGPVQLNRGLVRTARAHTTEMTGQRTLFHTPTFSSVCCWQAIAENVGTGTSVRGLHRAFMGSPGHRANLLNPRMTQVGVGIVSDGTSLWVTELFRQPAA